MDATMTRFLPFLITRRIADAYHRADVRDYQIMRARVLDTWIRNYKGIDSLNAA